MVTAERWYYTGWARVQVVARKKVTRPSRTDGSKHGIWLAARPTSPQTRIAIVQKDFAHADKGSAKMESQLISPIIFGAI